MVYYLQAPYIWTSGEDLDELVRLFTEHFFVGDAELQLCHERCKPLVLLYSLEKVASDG